MLRINWGRDKVGFINAFVLIGIVAATLIATLVLIILGLISGDWSSYILPLKFVLGGAYVLSMIAVLIRIGVYRVGVIKKQAMEKALQEQEEKRKNGIPG